jgi:hypothetical protein
MPVSVAAAPGCYSTISDRLLLLRTLTVRRDCYPSRFLETRGLSPRERERIHVVDFFSRTRTIRTSGLERLSWWWVFRIYRHVRESIDLTRMCTGMYTKLWWESETDGAWDDESKFLKQREIDRSLVGRIMLSFCERNIFPPNASTWNAISPFASQLFPITMKIAGSR